MVAPARLPKFPPRLHRPPHSRSLLLTTRPSLPHFPKDANSFPPYPIPAKPSSFMHLRTLLRNSAPLSLVLPRACALFPSPREYYPQRVSQDFRHLAINHLAEAKVPSNDTITNSLSLSKKVKSFAIKQIRTLYRAKHPGWGCLCGISALSALSFVSRLQVPPFQWLAASFISLAGLFQTSILCFQSVAASFPKTPGGGGMREESWMRRNVSVLTLLALSVLSLTAAPAAEAWGCRGHETVAALAEKHLTPQAKQALLALLTANPIDPQLKRYCGQRGLDPFVDSSTWADDERGRDPATAPWHFIDIPLSATQGSAQAFCGAGGCVTRAIADQLATLKDKYGAGAKRAAALRASHHSFCGRPAPAVARDQPTATAAEIVFR